MAVSDQRWHQLGDPVTPAEAQALQTLRALLPDSPLTHAWVNVTFRDREGRASEIDVILLHHNGLYFLELKGWHGRIVGDQMTWTVTPPNGPARSAKDPFIATDAKAKRFASELKHAAQLRGGKGPQLPFIQAVTVMHGQGSTLVLSEASAATTYGLDGYGVSGVRSIRDLLDAAPVNYANDIDAGRAKVVLALIKDLGLQATPKVRMVGQYVSVDRANLDRLVADATAAFWPALMARPEPLLLTDTAPLARYGQVARLAELLDTANPRPAARWVLVPKRAGAAAPTLDGVAVPVASGTWIELPESLAAGTVSAIA